MLGGVGSSLVIVQHKEAFYLPDPRLPGTLKYGCEDLALAADVE